MRAGGRGVFKSKMGAKEGMAGWIFVKRNGWEMPSVTPGVGFLPKVHRHSCAPLKTVWIRDTDCVCQMRDVNDSFEVAFLRN